MRRGAGLHSPAPAPAGGPGTRRGRPGARVPRRSSPPTRRGPRSGPGELSAETPRAPRPRPSGAGAGAPRAAAGRGAASSAHRPEHRPERRGARPHPEPPGARSGAGAERAAGRGAGRAWIRGWGRGQGRGQSRGRGGGGGGAAAPRGPRPPLPGRSANGASLRHSPARLGHPRPRTVPARPLLGPRKPRTPTRTGSSPRHSGADAGPGDCAAKASRSFNAFPPTPPLCPSRVSPNPQGPTAGWGASGGRAAGPSHPTRAGWGAGSPSSFRFAPNDAQDSGVGLCRLQSS